MAGWLVSTPYRNPAEDGTTEDWHYDIWLDNEFIERNYDPTTLPLANAIMPGQWYTMADDLLRPRRPISLTSGGQPNAGTFLIPGTGQMTIELNAWHRSKHNSSLDFTLPQGWWVNDASNCTFSSCQNQNPDVYWPFPVMEPWNYSGTGPVEPPLQEGDYVIVTGALVEDSMHHDGNEERWCWHEYYHGHGGWLEIHPLDSIRRVPKNQEPVVRATPKLFQLCRKDFNGSPLWRDVYLTAIPANPPSANSVLRFREIIDDRFTDMSTIDKHIVEISPYDPTKLHVFVSIKTLNGSDEGHFKAVYLLWWEETDIPRPTAVPWPTGVPTPQLEEDLPVCSKKPSLPQCEPEP